MAPLRRSITYDEPAYLDVQDKSWTPEGLDVQDKSWTPEDLDVQDKSWTPGEIDEVIDGKVWIQHDDTEDGVADELLEAGVPKKNIVLGFHHPKVRPYTGFAVN